MSIGTLTIILFGLLILFLLSGLPLTFCFGAAAIIVTLWQMGPEALYLIATRAVGTWSDFILIAIPLFVLMASFLERSGIADDLYEMMYRWMGGLGGGLGIGTIVICAIFAAMSGLSGTACITMGLVALPAMLKRKYDKQLAVGCVAGGATLGILIPPSIIMIIYGAITLVSVGKLFMAGVFPGIALALIFILYIGIRSLIQPELGPPLPKEERATWGEKLASLRAVVLPFILILLVLGVIYTGVCTPTEASGIGAFGALLCALIGRRVSLGFIKDSLTATLRLTGMIMWIVFGAKCFVQVYEAIGAPDLILGIMSGLEVNRWLIIIIMQIILLILGMFIDPAGIIMICTPVFLPIVEALGFDPIWFGILFTINMEMGYITPPFGFNLFYLKSIVPPDITMGDIYKSIVPFVFLGILGIAVVMIFPQLALWLPGTMIK